MESGFRQISLTSGNARWLGDRQGGGGVRTGSPGRKLHSRRDAENDEPIGSSGSDPGCLPELPSLDSELKWGDNNKPHASASQNEAFSAPCPCPLVATGVTADTRKPNSQ